MCCVVSNLLLFWVTNTAAAFFWFYFLFRTSCDADGTYEHQKEDINCLFHNLMGFGLLLSL